MYCCCVCGDRDHLVCTVVGVCGDRDQLACTVSVCVR